MKSPVRIFLFSLLCVVASLQAVAAQGPAQQTLTSQEGHFTVTVTSNLHPLQLGRIHSWTATVRTVDGEPVSGAEIRVSGGMPIHNHGFPTQPRVTCETEDGVYQVEGIKFSMRGPWVMVLDITSGDISDTVAFNINL